MTSNPAIQKSIDEKAMEQQLTCMLTVPHKTKSKRLQKYYDCAQTKQSKIFAREHWKLPGYDKPKPSCGTFRTVCCMHTKEHNHGKIVLRALPSNCGKMSCGKCFVHAINKSTERIVKRWKEYRKYQQVHAHGKRVRKARYHFTFSPGTGDAHGTYQTESELRKQLLSIIKEYCSFDAYMVVYHPARYDKSGGAYLPYSSPHYHVIVDGFIDNLSKNTTKEINDKTHWVVRNLGTLHSDNDIGALSKYLLSHAGISTKSEHTVKWYNAISYRKLKASKMVAEGVKCVDCGNKMLPCVLSRDLFVRSTVIDRGKDVYDWLVDAQYSTRIRVVEGYSSVFYRREIDGRLWQVYATGADLVV